MFGCVEGIFGAPNGRAGFGDSRTPFVVLTRITTGDGKRAAYLKAAKTIDDAIKDSKEETGMLHQTFDADPSDGTKFVWTEVYQNSAAFMKYLKNERRGEYLTQHGEIGKDFAMEVYGPCGSDVKGALARTGFPVQYFGSKLGFTTVDKVDLEAKKKSQFGSSSPFVMIGRVTTKPGKTDEYLKLARWTDNEVKATEPGMLHQTFAADPSDRTKSVWTEVYQNDAALVAHWKNEPVKEFMSQAAELTTEFSFEIYGTVSDEAKGAIQKTGVPATYFKTQLGHSRV